MIIAVACEGASVTEHFGHCESFMLFDTEGDTIKSAVSLPNPGHRPGFLPKFLKAQGAEVILSGGMGGGAIDIFNELGVQVVTGASGEARQAVESYLRGKLVSSGTVCHSHMH
ncbi:MAG: NifB/NifX family molybdenum-iron cluster-binding protein [Clostridia bacterium]|nr:NifB/NifX family molybdenum-iron cluster-binding protein [Clostridia bacterium]